MMAAVGNPSNKKYSKSLVVTWVGSLGTSATEPSAVEALDLPPPPPMRFGSDPSPSGSSKSKSSAKASPPGSDAPTPRSAAILF